MNNFNATLNFTPSAIAGVSGFVSESDLILAHRHIRGYARNADTASIVIGFGCDTHGAWLPLPWDKFGREIIKG